MKLLQISNDVVAGRNDNICMSVDRLDSPTCIADARSCVSATRLQQNMAPLDVWQLLKHQVLIFLGGNNPNIFFWHNGRKPLQRQLQQCFPNSQNVKKLLGLIFTAEWPKTATDAACHDNKVIIFAHIVSYVYSRSWNHQLRRRDENNSMSLFHQHVARYINARHGISCI